MRISKSRHLTLAACTLAVAAVLTGSAQAALLVDRGLPNTNLNNAAGANRSNVAWAGGPEVLYGDTITNTSGGTWNINSIHLWVVGGFDANSLKLLGESTASLPGTLSTLSTVYTTTTPVYYTGTTAYQSQGGDSRTISEIDFAVNLTLLAGQQYVYFLDGTGGTYTVPFMSASNAGLSGTPQQQADGLIWEADFDGSSLTSVSSFSTGDPDGGWDKASDFNVQVFGTALAVAAVPEPGSMTLLGLGLAGLALARRRKH